MRSILTFLQSKESKNEKEEKKEENVGKRNGGNGAAPGKFNQRVNVLCAGDAESNLVPSFFLK